MDFSHMKLDTLLSGMACHTEPLTSIIYITIYLYYRGQWPEPLPHFLARAALWDDVWTLDLLVLELFSLFCHSFLDHLRIVQEVRTI